MCLLGTADLLGHMYQTFALGRGGVIISTGGGLALEPFPDWTSLALGEAPLRNLAFSSTKTFLRMGCMCRSSPFVDWPSVDDHLTPPPLHRHIGVSLRPQVGWKVATSSFNRRGLTHITMIRSARTVVRRFLHSTSRYALVFRHEQHRKQRTP